jgi:hypothetical protein
MNQEKYIGLDVHQATISIAILDWTGKVVVESILETKAATILQFIQGLRGSLFVTFEEGTWAAWLYDLLKPHVSKLVVCKTRQPSTLGRIGLYTATEPPQQELASNRPTRNPGIAQSAKRL